MGRRGSIYCASIARAKKKALALTTIITLMFIVLWGPYYGIGIFSWFNSDEAKRVPREVGIITTKMVCAASLSCRPICSAFFFYSLLFSHALAFRILFYHVLFLKFLISSFDLEKFIAKMIKRIASAMTKLD